MDDVVSCHVFNYPIHRGLVGWQGVHPGSILVRTRVGVTQRFARDPYAVWDAGLNLIGTSGFTLQNSKKRDFQSPEQANAGT